MHITIARSPTYSEQASVSIRTPSLSPLKPAHKTKGSVLCPQTHLSSCAGELIKPKAKSFKVMPYPSRTQSVSWKSVVHYHFSRGVWLIEVNAWHTSHTHLPQASAKSIGLKNRQEGSTSFFLLWQDLVGRHNNLITAPREFHCLPYTHTSQGVERKRFFWKERRTCDHTHILKTSKHITFSSPGKAIVGNRSIPQLTLKTSSRVMTVLPHGEMFVCPPV